jgi:TolB protein
MTIPATRWREAAHFISDRVFKYITGIDGSFSTRVAYVLQYTHDGKTRYRLEVADADGAQARSILDSDEPILSPSWSPDGQNIAYVSFEGGKPAIYTQNLATQQRVSYY